MIILYSNICFVLFVTCSCTIILISCKHNIRTTKKTSDHGSNSEEEEVGEDCDNDGNESKLKNEPEDDESEVEEEETEEDEEDEDNPQLFKQEEKQKTPYSKCQYLFYTMKNYNPTSNLEGCCK